MNLNTRANIAPDRRTVIHFQKKALSRGVVYEVLQKFGMSKTIPKNNGDTTEFRRAEPYAVNPTPLVEGITPSGDTIRYTNKRIQILPYGHVVPISDEILDIDPYGVFVKDDLITLEGEHVVASNEAILWGVLRAGTNVFLANGSARTDVNTPISKTKVQAVIRALNAQKAKKITSIQSGSPDFGTRPIEASFVAVCHTNCEQDIRALPGFTPVAEYGQRSALSEYELGCLESVRFVMSPDLTPFIDAGGAKSGSGTEMISSSGTSADVYPVVFFAREAYAYISLKANMGLNNASIEPIIIPVDMMSKSDPLNQRGFVGSKWRFGAGILNEAWMARLEVAATKQ
ncbi:MAG: N4-gp56 family major capsid protein [Magnetococcales bacterium]|nr:N4-gp56 family major capsid protein [Magnetococcales bacterium]